MNKDAILATLIGFGIGLLITGLVLVAPNVLKLLPKLSLPSFLTVQTKKDSTPAPSAAPAKAAFAVESPLPESIEDSAEILVSGTAVNGSTVVIAGPAGESVVPVDASGKFAGKLTLVEGKNDISVTSLSKTDTKTIDVTVYYTEEKL